MSATSGMRPDAAQQATPPGVEPDELLRVRDLRIANTRSGRTLVNGIGFTVRRGETVALVGESGSGKSLTAKALVGLLPKGLSCSGSAMLGNDDLLTASPRRLRQLRGSGVSMLLQDPFTMLNPLIRVSTLLGETLLATPSGAPRRSRTRLTAEIDRRLAEVGITAAGASRKYPWELSGGMRQRAGMAASIAKDPGLLIADEPTTALDATIQREVLRLLHRIQKDRGMGLLLITHDLRVAFSMSDHVLVMSDGNLLEQADPQTLRQHPKTDYTRKLLAADLPLHRRLEQLHREALTPEPSSGDSTTVSPTTRAPDAAPIVASGRDDNGPGALLQIRNLKKRFGSPSPEDQAENLWALNGVDIELRDGTNVGIIGESGSGKTTLARCLLGLETPTSGSIEAAGLRLDDRSTLDRNQSGRARRLIQCVFQDPYSSLNPAHGVGYILGEAIRLRSGGELDSRSVKAEIERLLTEVGLPADFAGRRPATLSGGQRQRVAIARALAMRPKILICDEPVAALDVSVQAQVLQVLRDVQAQGVNLLFITHDLAVVRQMTQELVVLYHGEIVERGATAEVIDSPRHDYTRRLIAAVPTGTPDWLADDRTTSR
ncbi:ABC transporter ATP-binding protein [Nonomuraea sp. NPDC048901]|uniref:ABC transporter ATP-binding protein n=1 Tax=Nonomuraea sp. NPDC048901 TaxID=3155627 RepID=UPI003404AA73